MTTRELSKPTTRHPLTVDAYMRMIETGILGKEDRVELLNGALFDMSPIGSAHAAVVKRLNHLFAARAGDSLLISVQDPIHLSDISMPQPDLALLKPRDDFYAAAHPGPHDVWLLIEVSDSTLAYDVEQKLPAYAAAGIPEVWIVNLNDRWIDRYLTPSAQKYAVHERYLPRDEVPLTVIAKAVLPVSAILGADKQ